MKLRLRRIWRAWLFGVFWGTTFKGHDPIATFRYFALHLGPFTLMLEWTARLKKNNC